MYMHTYVYIYILYIYIYIYILTFKYSTFSEFVEKYILVLFCAFMPNFRGYLILVTFQDHII